MAVELYGRVFEPEKRAIHYETRRNPSRIACGHVGFSPLPIVTVIDRIFAGPRVPSQLAGAVILVGSRGAVGQNLARKASPAVVKELCGLRIHPGFGNRGGHLLQFIRGLILVGGGAGPGIVLLPEAAVSAIFKTLPADRVARGRDPVGGAAETSNKCKRNRSDPDPIPERFVAELSARLEKGTPARRRLERRATLEEIIAVVERMRGEKWKIFRDRYGDAGRDLVLYLGRRFCGLSIRELSGRAGIEYMSTATTLSRFSRRLLKDRTLSRELERASAELKNE
jgi:hypothetical protein